MNWRQRLYLEWKIYQEAKWYGRWAWLKSRLRARKDRPALHAMLDEKMSIPIYCRRYGETDSQLRKRMGKWDSTPVHYKTFPQEKK